MHDPTLEHGMQKLLGWRELLKDSWKGGVRILVVGRATYYHPRFNMDPSSTYSTTILVKAKVSNLGPRASGYLYFQL